MNKVKRIARALALSAFAVSSASAAVTIVDDSFDDGDIGSNTSGVGTGFAAAAVVSGASVTETNGVVTLDSSLNGGRRAIIAAKESVDTTSADGASYLFEGVSFDFAGDDSGNGSTHRTYLGIRGASGAADAQANPGEGFYVEFGFGGLSGNADGTSTFFYNDASNVKTTLANWTFDNLLITDTLISTNIMLDISIMVNNTGWSLDITGDTVGGSAISFSGTHADSSIANTVNTGYAYAFNQSESPNLAVSIDRVVIESLAEAEAVIVPSVSEGYNPLEVVFDGSGSGSIGTITSYEWVFGDGNTASGALATNTFLLPNTYTNWLTIMDDQGYAATNSVVITVNPALQANIVTSQEGLYPPLEVVFDANTSASVYGNVTNYYWAFGDGNTASGVMATNTYTVAGSYTAWLTVMDDQGNISSNSVEITAAVITYGVIIDDAFDDGDIAVNTLGVGSGFVSGAQSGGSVTEINDAAVLDSPLNGGRRARMSSNDTADTTAAEGASYLFEGVSFAFSSDDSGNGGTHRTYIGIRDNAGAGDEGVNPEEGFYLEFGYGAMSGNADGTSSFVYNSASNVKTTLANWTFDNLLVTDAEVSSNVVLDIEMVVTPSGWSLDILGDTYAGGSAISFSGTHAAAAITNTVDSGHVFAHNQSESPNLAMSFDRVVVEQIQGAPLVVPNITSISHDGTTVSLSWDSEPGFNYNILSKTALTGSWSTKLAAVPGAGATTSTNVTPSGETAEFFQIEAY